MEEKIPVLLAPFVISIVLVPVVYLFASVYQNNKIEPLFRGMLIGSNVWINASLWLWFSAPELAVLSVVLLLPAVHKSASAHPAYKTMLSYGNCLLPMSWPVLLPGLLFGLINLLFSPAGSSKRFKHFSVRNEFAVLYGTWVVYGGIISPIRGFSGFNMGNVVFIKPGKGKVLQHELGHTLSLAVFGSLFHYIGAIDENYIQKVPADAYAELIAESNVKAGNGTWSMWT